IADFRNLRGISICNLKSNHPRVRRLYLSRIALAARWAGSFLGSTFLVGVFLAASWSGGGVTWGGVTDRSMTVLPAGTLDSSPASSPLGGLSSPWSDRSMAATDSSSEWSSVGEELAASCLGVFPLAATSLAAAGFTSTG